MNTKKMSDNIRHTGFFAAVGILLAILVIGGIAAAGFKIPALRFPNIGARSENGNLLILITDAPVNVTAIDVAIDKVQVHKAGGNESGWITLPFVDNKTSISLDLLKLQNVTRDLSIGEVSSGNYTKIRLDILNATVTYADNSTEPVTVPPGHIDIIVHFEVETGNTTKVLIDMTAEFVAVSQSGNLRPVLKAKAIVLPS